jgi:hypothetical protein
MQKQMNNTRTSKVLGAAVCAVLVVVCGVAIAAQSGRQVKKSSAMPIPTPEASPTPTPNPEKPKPAFTFIVGIDRYAGFSRVSLTAYSGVLRNCADRLDDSLSVKAELAPSDLSRADAVRKAKEGKEAHVVWLQLKPNNMSGETRVEDDPYDVFIQYAVFAPITGKQVTSGNVYPDAYRNKRIRVPSPTMNEDYYLNQAARGAAERILDHFHVRIPNSRGLHEQ